MGPNVTTPVTNTALTRQEQVPETPSTVNAGVQGPNVEPTTSAPIGMLTTPIDKASIQCRRVKWFERVRRRFALMSFGDLAKWAATAPGSVRYKDREQALDALQDSIKHGEFGPADVKRCIVWLPKPPPGSDVPLGQFCLRLNHRQIVQMGAGIASDLHAPPALCRKWLEARTIQLPPWLAQLVVEPEPPPAKLKKVAEKTWDAWVAQHRPKSPTKREADAWAIAEGYSTTEVRPNFPTRRKNMT